MDRSSWAACLLVGALVAPDAGCASTQAAAAARRMLTVVVTGDAQQASLVEDAFVHAGDLPVRVRRAELPASAPLPPTFGEISEGLAHARRAYIDADFAACLRDVGDEARVTDLLASSRRDLAGRVLFWRVACDVGSGDTVEAGRTARHLAVFGLDVPSDVEAAAPEVEATIAAAQREVASTARTAMHLTSPAPTAVFALDGRTSTCGSPCVIDVPPGDHVVRVEAEGETPVVTVVRAEGTRIDRALPTTPAPPSLAGEQWVQRYAGTPLVDASTSMRLLSQSVRAQDLLLMTVEGREHALRLRAAYAIDGDVRARDERSAAPDALLLESRALLRELLLRSGTVVERPVYRSPVFWSVVAGAAVTAAIVAGLLVAPVPTRTQVGL